MSDEAEIDVDALRTELDQIKDAMGIEERYEAAGEVWLFFGVLVGVASALSQYVHIEELPVWLHTGIWLGVFGLGFAGWWLRADAGDAMGWSTTGKPNIALVFAIPYLASIPVQTIVREYVGDLGYHADSAMVLSIILVMLGVAYGLLGTVLKAYYIQRSHRLPFYVGALLLVGLGVTIPQSPTLERWAYAAFGAAYVIYAVVTFVYLRRT